MLNLTKSSNDVAGGGFPCGAGVPCKARSSSSESLGAGGTAFFFSGCFINVHCQNFRELKAAEGFLRSRPRHFKEDWGK